LTSPADPNRSTEVVTEVRGQTLELLPERAISWQEASTLLVADTHFGKAATFRRAGLAVPAGTTADALERLDSALGRTGACRVIFLGDLLHAREGRAPSTLDAMAAWRRARAGLDLILVRGNHDRAAGDPPPELTIRCVDPPLTDGPFAFAHLPGSMPGHHLFAGHLHPAVKLVGRGRARARLPCFWFRPDGAVLPAFGDFTGAADVAPLPGDRIWVVTGAQVMPVR
jgi:uncharacterized protein